MYTWYIVNPYNGHPVIGGGFTRPLDGTMSPSDCSMLIPTWESFLLASK